MADERIERLPDDQRQLAERFSAFVESMDDKYFSRVASINGGADFEDRYIENEYSDFDLRVTRGAVVEKAGRMRSFGHQSNPGRGEGVLTWGSFYSLDFHPKSPLVGMLHATIVLQFFEDGEATVGGWLGVMPGTRVEADLAQLEAVTEAHFDAHGKDPSLYRRLVCK
ncbi:MAG: hypothetical protein GWN29_00260, partial [Gammaproteobacteria bacterium]|nr:hypothetical protein [Gammaproteobacteria bacterium]